MSTYPTKPAADSCREEVEKEECDTIPSSLVDQGPSSASTESWTLVDVSALSSLSVELPKRGGKQLPSAPLSASPLESVTRQPIASEASDKTGTSAYMTQEEFKKVTERRQEEIRRTMHGMKEASKVDLCFLVDCTGSMQPWVDGVKDGISKFANQLPRCYPDSELRVAFVGYTDYDQPEDNRTKVLDFTEDFKSFYDFVDEVETPAGVGGDAAEDVMGGLDMAVNKLKWRDNGTKILIHIADSPAHGKKFHDSNVGDDYPEGDPAHISHNDIMERIADLHIQYWFGYIQKNLTDKMVDVLCNSLLKLSDRELSIQQFDAREPKLVELLLTTSTLASMSSTVDSQLGEQQLVRKFTLHSECPDFSTLTAHAGQKSRSKCARLSDDQVLLDPPCEPILLKCAPNPFAVGGLRLAYHAYDDTSKKHVVLKMFKRTGEKWSNPKRYMEVAEIEKLATSYSEDFNCEKPPEVPKISFLTVDVIDFGTNPDFGSRWSTIEDFVDGTYQKFNNNTGWVSFETDPISAAMQAFSHYTWVKSGKKLLICDIQGCKRDGGILLTDPSIHAKEYWRFGKTNLGPPGIRRFFEMHECNEICMKLDLEPYPLTK